jgi:hypothetical protein
MELNWNLYKTVRALRGLDMFIVVYVLVYMFLMPVITTLMFFEKRRRVRLVHYFYVAPCIK